MIAFEFKTVFNEGGEARVTSNWKTQDKWQDEKEIDETDWLDEQTGRESLSKYFSHCRFSLACISNFESVRYLHMAHSHKNLNFEISL